MKKLFLFVTSCFIFLISCEKGDNSPGTSVGSIVGVWDETYMTMYATQGYYTSYPNGQVITSQDTSEVLIGTPLMNRQWTFSSNSDFAMTGTSIFGSINYSGTWQQNGNNLVVNFVDLDDPGYPAETLDITINTITNTNLTLTYIDSDTLHVSGGGIEFYEDLNIFELEKH